MTKNNSQNYIAPQPAYFSKVKLKGYKSIKDVEIEFKEGLNIVIGPNGSGKTNLLDFIADAGKTGTIKTPYVCEFNYHDFDYSNNKYRHWFYSKKAEQTTFLNNSNTPSQKIRETLKKDKKYLADKNEYELIFNQTTFEYYLDLNFMFNFTKIIFDIPKFINGLNQPYAFNFQYKNDAKTFTSFTPVKFDHSTWPEFHFNSKILNWLHNAFLYIIRENKSFTKRTLCNVNSKIFTNQLFDKVINNLQKFSPIKNIIIDEDVSVKTKKTNGEISVDIKYLRLSFLVDGEWISWDMLSDGTKRLFYIIFSLSFNEHHTKYLIEEPELGIHPHQLYLLMTFLKEKSKENQIIITTHSPQVLNILDDDELDRIIISKNEKKKGTTLRNLSKREIKKAKSFMDDDGLSLSDYWIHSDLEEQIL